MGNIDAEDRRPKPGTPTTKYGVLFAGPQVATIRPGGWDPSDSHERQIASNLKCLFAGALLKPPV